MAKELQTNNYLKETTKEKMKVVVLQLIFSVYIMVGPK